LLAEKLHHIGSISMSTIPTPLPTQAMLHLRLGSTIADIFFIKNK